MLSSTVGLRGYTRYKKHTVWMLTRALTPVGQNSELQGLQSYNFGKPCLQLVTPGVVPEDVPACFEYELHGGGKIVCPKEEELKPPKSRFTF